MDFVTHFPQTSQGHDTVWVIVDRLTKLALFGYADDLHYGGILLVVHTGDCPVTWSASVHSIQSGSQVYDSFLGEFQRAMGTRLMMSPTFHPKTNGQSERIIQMLKDVVRECVLDLKGSWEEHLPLDEFSYNNSYQASI